MSIPAACRGIQSDINGVRQQREQLQEEFQHAGLKDKPALQAQIRALNAQLVNLRIQLAGIIAANPADQPPIEAFFIGSSTFISTNEHAPGPYYNDLSFRVNITENGTGITILDFPEIRTLFPTPLGIGETTITLIDGGTGSYAAGKISLPMALHFASAIDSLYHDDSDLSLVLSTDPPDGRPLTPEPFGNVTLAGSGQFMGGFLNGSTGTLTVSGTIKPWVPVTAPYVLNEPWKATRDQVLAVGLVPKFFGGSLGGMSPGWRTSLRPPSK
jgi:hypothetical protein